MLMTGFFSKLLIGYFVLLLSWTKPTNQTAFRWQLVKDSRTRRTYWNYGPSIIGTGYARHVEYSKRKIQRFEGFIRRDPYGIATIKQKITKIKEIQRSFGKIQYGPSWFQKYPGFKSKSLSSSRVKGGRGKGKGGIKPTFSSIHYLFKGSSAQQKAKATGVRSEGYGPKIKRFLDSIEKMNNRFFFKNHEKLEPDDAEIVQKVLREPHVPNVETAGRTNPRINEMIELMMEEAREAIFDVEMTKRRRKRDLHLNAYPSIYGVNVDEVPTLNPKGFMRNGTSSNNHTCWYVRSVPPKLRFMIPGFYKKYTEAYGIPVVGSANVSDAGLQRACYITRVMFASRHDIRQAYYKWFGRIAMIADVEETTDLPEHNNLSPEKNKNTRGLGATIFSPVSSVGDDNQRCCCSDRYPKQDILVHELAHGIHLVCANNVVPGFNQRLRTIYNNAMSNGKWQGTYAAKNKEEYWAMGASFFYNSYHRNDYSFNGFNVTGRASLQLYDVDLYDLLSEIFPCQNQIIPRCMWRTQFECSLDSMTLLADYDVSQSSRCPIKKDVMVTSLQECLDLACFHLSSVIALRGPQCRVLDCPENNAMLTPQADQSQAWRIYTVGTLPAMNLTKEHEHHIAMDCTVPRPRSRCRVKKYYRVRYVNQETITEDKCESLGGCFRPNNGTIRCHYPRQDCLDFFNLCPMHAAAGQCEKDPGFMWINCALSCDTCDFLRTLNHTKMQEMCRDTNIYCKIWADKGECEREEAKPYMYKYCEASCSQCIPENPIEFAKLDKSSLQTTSSTTTTTTSSPQNAVK